MATGLFNLKQVNQAISQGAWSGYIAPKWVEYLVVAGGGGGAAYTAGGGGGGGLLTGIVTVAANTSYTVTVGSGGAAGTTSTWKGSNGSTSVFGAISTTGGGGGGSFNVSPTTGFSGGSGGGGADGSVGGLNISGQGNVGGNGFYGSLSVTAGGGGGGAGSAGLVGVSSAGGNGGSGIASAISGTVTTYAGGGGGSAVTTAGLGGVGGGGAGTGVSGSVNSGGGGGSIQSSATGGAGGSGIVVVRYPGSIQFFTGGTLSYANGYMIHTFYASGTLAPTTPTPYVTSYQISRSLRFNRSDSAYLNRTPASTGSRTTYTLSLWIKLGNFTTGNDSFIWSSGDATSGDAPSLFWKTYAGSCYFGFTAGTSTDLATTSVYRDPSAWYHVVVAVDTTQATSSNRIKMYVNGTQITAFSTATYPSQNLTFNVNTSSYPAYLGCLYASGTVRFWEGYMTEVNFIDGQALTPSSFGYTNPATGVWSPLAFVGTYGTNGFYLNFSDNSNTTAATLGKDYSGNGNNWTPNNFSVTAGAGNDSLVDSPTSYGTDTGVGGSVRGNYCTMNPINVLNATSANGNLDWTVTAGETNNGVGTFAITTGKWYWEVVQTSTSVGAMIGVCDATSSATNRSWQSANGWAYLGNGLKYTNNASASYGATYSANTDVIGVALDMDAGTLTFYKNGASQGIAYSVFSGKTITPYLGSPAGSGGSSTTATFNFGQRPFAYTAPSGYKALCTQNLPTPTIGATSTTLATSYFNPVTYTGLGATQTVTVGFQPDFTWIKNRTLGANWHVLTDSVRGVQKEIYTNSTAAEATLTTSGVNQFNAGGFQILGNTNDYNGSTSNYVAWNWRASNATAVTNTAGSITSTVSANTTSGFSIATFTSQASGTATVGHGLGVAPSMVIVKGRNVAYEWYTYHVSLGASAYVSLSNTAASASSTTLWNATSPTSSVFSLGTAWTGSNTFVAYCFAEVAGYSKFGSYVGNNSADGPFAYCGFRPAFVMIKSASQAGVNWVIFDTKRSTTNVASGPLFPNASSAEGNSTPQLDILSNGFKWRNTDANSYPGNVSGDTYIFAAFAEAPFKYSLAR